MKEATEYQIKEWNAFEFEALERAKAKGCIVKEANIAEFQKAMAPPTICRNISFINHGLRRLKIPNKQLSYLNI